MFLNSLNGKILLTLLPIYAICVLVSATTPLFSVIFVEWCIIIFLLIWPLVVNKKISILFLHLFFKNRMPVELYDGDTHYYSLAEKMTNGQYKCPVYFSSNIGEAILLPNGTVDVTSKSSYIKRWYPLNKSDHVLHILTYGIAADNNNN